MVNSVVIIGRLTRDPELRRTSSGMSVASFTIASDDSRKDANGEKQTVFLGVSIFGNAADNVVKFTHKGSLVGVIGRLTQRKYTRTRDNVEVTVTEIVANQVEFLEPKAAGADSTGYAPDAPSPKMDNQAEEAESNNVDSIDVVDDDLPF